MPILKSVEVEAQVVEGYELQQTMDAPKSTEVKG